MDKKRKTYKADRVTPKVSGTIGRNFLKTAAARGVADFLAFKITKCWMCEGEGCEDCDNAGYYIELDMALPLSIALEITHPND